MVHSRVLVMKVGELYNQFTFIFAFDISLNPKSVMI